MRMATCKGSALRRGVRGVREKVLINPAALLEEKRELRLADDGGVRRGLGFVC